MARIDELKRMRSDELRETAHHLIARGNFGNFENHDMWIAWKQLGQLYEGIFRLATVLQRESTFSFTAGEIAYFQKLKTVAKKIKDIRMASNAADAALQSLTTEQKVLDFDYGSFFAGL